MAKFFAYNKDNTKTVECQDDINVVATKQPHIIAQKFLHDIGNPINLTTYQNDLYAYRNGAYKKLPNEWLQAKLWTWIPSLYVKTSTSRRHLKPTRNLVANIVDAIKAQCYIHSWESPPFYKSSNNEGKPDPKRLIMFRNGILDIETKKFRPNDPNLFNLVALPYDYVPDAPQPKLWLSFLNSLWPNDKDSILLLQEIMGYEVSSSNDLEKIFLSVGPTRAGKGVISSVKSALIGKENVSGLSLNSITSDFAMQTLIDKQLWLVPDARLSPKNREIVLEKLLTISGRDTIDIQRKYRDAWSGELNLKIDIVSNEILHFIDLSEAFSARLVCLAFQKSFQGKEDPSLKTKLLNELPGILLWSLNGLKRLKRNNGIFTEPESSKTLMKKVKEANNPLNGFINKYVILDKGKSLSVKELYRIWTAYRLEQEKPAESKRKMIQMLLTAYPMLEKIKSHGSWKIKGVTRI